MAGAEDSAIEVGKRVWLRHPVDADGPAFVRMVESSRDLHQPWVYAPVSLERFRAYTVRLADDRNEGLLVCTRDAGMIVGVYNISEIVRGAFLSAYLGVYANAAYAGRGLMSEGLTLVLRHAFRTLGLHRLEANIQPGNDRSRLLFERAGFRLEGYSPRYLMIGGVWCDHERWAVTLEDWPERTTSPTDEGASP